MNGLQDLLKNQKQLGALLLGVGLILTFMGMMLFFEGNLLRLGNVRHPDIDRIHHFCAHFLTM